MLRLCGGPEGLALAAPKRLSRLVRGGRIVCDGERFFAKHSRGGEPGREAADG
jgi:hypothetical protein